MNTKNKVLPNQYTPNWLEGLDGRTALAQELRGRYASLVNDLGGEDALSYQEKSLVTRALWLEYHLQLQEEKLATGADFDSGKWVQACNALNGIFNRLGLKRVAKEVSLGQYIKSKGGIQ